jgi:hypothetical protein
MGKIAKLLLIANVCLWVYFWIAFGHASYAFRPHPLGHPARFGYTFWGHSLTQVESGLVYRFFRIAFFAEFPSFLLAMLVAHVLSPHMLLNWFFAGISGEGWLLLAVMALSFLQWYFIGWVAQKLCRKWFSR